MKIVAAGVWRRLIRERSINYHHGKQVENVIYHIFGAAEATVVATKAPACQLQWTMNTTPTLGPSPPTHNTQSQQTYLVATVVCPSIWIYQRGPCRIFSANLKIPRNGRVQCNISAKNTLQRKRSIYGRFLILSLEPDQIPRTPGDVNKNTCLQGNNLKNKFTRVRAH